MAKFIKSVLLFIIYSTFGYCILLTLAGLIIPHKYLANLKYKLADTSFTFSRLEEVKQEENLDILFLGSSHAYRGFDTRMYTEQGYKTFNLGSSTQTPLQSKLLLQRYLDRLKPKQIIIEVYPLIFCSDGVESGLDIISNDINDRHSIDMAVDLNHPLIYHSLLYGSIKDFLGLNRSYSEEKWKAISNYISGGFVDRQLRYFNHVEHPKDHWEFHEQQFQHFEEILSILKEKDIDVLLVFAPITKSKYKSYDNNKDFDIKMKNYGEYYNLHEILALDDSLHFYDSNHLNKLGVKIFNESIMNLLKANKNQ